MRYKEYLNQVYETLGGINKSYANFKKRSFSNNIVWKEGSTEVINYSDNNISLPTIFFIPSLINKSYILDLNEQVSMVRHFASLGFKVYLINFKEPLEEESNMGFQDYSYRIEKAIVNLSSVEPIICIGYCLGGLIASSIVARKKRNFIGQVLLATPLDFSIFQKSFIFDSSNYFNSFLKEQKSIKKISSSLVQLFFNLLDLNKTFSKYQKYSSLTLEEFDNYIEIENWVNDGISLTHKFSYEMLNLVSSNKILLNIQTEIPTLLIFGSKDPIVPLPDISLIEKLFLCNEILAFNTGHVGLVTNPKISSANNHAIFNWIKKTIIQD